MNRYTVFVAIATLLVALGAPGLLAGQVQSAEQQSPNPRLSGEYAPTITATVYLPLAAKDYTPPFRDDFGNTSSGWPSSESLHSAVGYVDGEYRIMLKDAGWLSRASLECDVADFRVEVDVRALSSVYGAYGLVFDLTDAGYYLFEVGYGQYQLLRRNFGDGSVTMVVEATPSLAIRSGTQTNRLKVVRTGWNSGIKLYANGQLLRETSEGTLSHGYVGLAASGYEANYEARFDNFLLVFGTADTTTQSLGGIQSERVQSPPGARSRNSGFTEEPGVW